MNASVVASTVDDAEERSIRLRCRTWGMGAEENKWNMAEEVIEEGEVGIFRRSRGGDKFQLGNARG